METIAGRIRAARSARRWSLDDLAGASGLSNRQLPERLGVKRHTVIAMKARIRARMSKCSRPRKKGA